jgi:hypothetical protein
MHDNSVHHATIVCRILDQAANLKVALKMQNKNSVKVSYVGSGGVNGLL